ncbi:MAG: cobalamin-dependent protein [Magnetococcales bacterium]|nr:cobalamin-dependent protein [Magnetococcales bacterium]
MKSLLINPDHGYLTATPWGVLSVGSYLTNVKKYDIELLDASIEGAEKTFRKLRPRLRDYSLIGIGAFSTDAPFLVNMCDMIKEENPRCKVIVGGPHAFLCPEQTAQYRNIDFISYGNGELAFSGLMEQLNAGRQQWEEVPGIVYKRDSVLFRTRSADSVPFYDTDYRLLDERARVHFSDNINILAGRGCPYKCTFCFTSITDQRWRGKPIEHLGRELKALVNEYNPRQVYFRDELFFRDKQRILDLIEFYKSNHFTFRWRASIRATDFREGYVDESLLRELETAGCECLKFGFESGSDRVLKYIKKGIKKKNIHNVVDTMRKVPGIKLNASFLVGLPGEAYGEMIETITLAAHILQNSPNVQIIGPQYYRVYPGGSLYKTVVEQYGFKAPDSLEEWKVRYDNPVNRHGFADTAVDYPWLSPGESILAKNAALIVDIVNPTGLRYIDTYKKRMLSPFRVLIRLRLHFGFFRFLYDIRLANAILEFSIWDWSERSALFRYVKNTSVFKLFKRTATYHWLSSQFIG